MFSGKKEEKKESKEKGKDESPQKQKNGGKEGAGGADNKINLGPKKGQDQ